MRLFFLLFFKLLKKNIYLSKNKKMKQYIILLLCLFLSITLFKAQEKDLNYSFFYELKYRSDTILNKYSSELYVLDLNIKNQTSYFYGGNMIKNDSILNKLKSSVDGFSINFNDLKKSYIKEVISLNKKDKNITVYDVIDGNLFKYNQSLNYSWSLESGRTEDVLNYKSFGAKTELNGREWIAYYTPQLPLSYGPYKFSGLPGLITKIQDTKGDFEFVLVAIEKNQYKNPTESNKYIETEENKVMVYYDQYLADPGKSMREGVIISENGTKFIMNGKVPKNVIDDKINRTYKSLVDTYLCLEPLSKKCSIEHKYVKRKLSQSQ